MPLTFKLDNDLNAEKIKKIEKATLYNQHRIIIYLQNHTGSFFENAG